MTPSQKLKEGQKHFFATPPDFDEAKTCFQAVTAMSPNWIEGHHWLASTFEEMGEKGSAVKAYKEAIRCDDKDPRAKIGLGQLLLTLGHYHEAVAELERGLSLNLHYAEADARLFLAEAYEKTKQIRKSVEQWQKVRDMEPMYPSYEEPRVEAEHKLREYADHLK